MCWVLLGMMGKFRRETASSPQMHYFPNSIPKLTCIPRAPSLLITGWTLLHAHPSQACQVFKLPLSLFTSIITPLKLSLQWEKILDADLHLQLLADKSGTSPISPHHPFFFFVFGYSQVLCQCLLEFSLEKKKLLPKIFKSLSSVCY